MTIEIRGSNILAALENQGYRSTLPRREIVENLEKRNDGFTAEDLVRDLPHIGRATVFRTIKLLLEAGIICKLSLINGEPRYSLAHAEHHHHTVCVTCGTIGEFHAGTVERVLRLIGNEVGGSIIGHRIELYISCAKCARENRPIPSSVHTHTP